MVLQTLVSLGRSHGYAIVSERAPLRHAARGFRS